MNRKFSLQICVLVALLSAFTGFALAQSLGEIARNSRTGKRAGKVITNDTLPEAKGPANGAATRPDGVAMTAAPAPESVKDAVKVPASSPETAKPDEREKQLREQIQTVSAKIDEYGTKIEQEPNEASRAAMQNMIDSYVDMRQESQHQLDELLAAKSKKETNQ